MSVSNLKKNQQPVKSKALQKHISHTTIQVDNPEQQECLCSTQLVVCAKKGSDESNYQPQLAHKIATQWVGGFLPLQGGRVKVNQQDAQGKASIILTSQLQQYFEVF